LGETVQPTLAALQNGKNNNRRITAISEVSMTETILHLQGKDFQQEVVRSEIPVLVDFYADWCGPCRMIAPAIEQLSKEYAGRVKFVKVDTDENQELAGSFGIMSIPTVMFFSKGKIEDMVVGAVPAAVFKRKLDELVSA
jgi:thioredoxin 1